MKISNFRDLKRGEAGPAGHSHEWATVDVTEGWLWKKTRAAGVFKEKYWTYWKWSATGEHTPGYIVEALASAYKSKEAFAELQSD